MEIQIRSAYYVSFPAFGWNETSGEQNNHLKQSRSKIEKMVHGNYGKLFSAIPLISGQFIGLTRLFLVFSNDRRLHSSGLWTTTGQIARGLTETAGLGLLCVIVDTVVYLFRKILQKKENNPHLKKGSISRDKNLPITKSEQRNTLSGERTESSDGRSKNNKSEPSLDGHPRTNSKTEAAKAGNPEKFSIDRKRIAAFISCLTTRHSNLENHATIWSKDHNHYIWAWYDPKESMCIVQPWPAFGQHKNEKKLWLKIGKDKEIKWLQFDDSSVKMSIEALSSDQEKMRDLVHVCDAILGKEPLLEKNQDPKISSFDELESFLNQGSPIHSIYTTFFDNIPLQNAEISEPISFKDPTKKKEFLEEIRGKSEQAQKILKDVFSSTIKGTLDYISPPPETAPDFFGVTIEPGFFENNPTFSWQSTQGVKEDMIRDGKREENNSVVYGAASQFNGCEATDRYVIPFGQATNLYKNDRTQGPQAQLAFCPEQVELINAGGHLGFNGLSQVLDEETIAYHLHGYFTPATSIADKVIDQLKNRGHLIQYTAVSSVPNHPDAKKNVDMLLVAAPAFGDYDFFNDCTDQQQLEIQFLFALNSFRAQFLYCIEKAQKNSHPVIFKPAATGLGAFGNKTQAVAKAYYQAALEFDKQLKDYEVKVEFQVFGNSSRVEQMKKTFTGNS